MTLDVVNFNRRLLVASELWLCIAQLERSKKKLTADDRNQRGADAVRTVLSEDASGMAPIDLNCEDSRLTRLLILPELSLGVDDWGIVDQAARSYSKPLVLVAGFGFTKVGSIRDRLNIATDISDDRNVNFGCVWISLPAVGGAPAVFDAQYYCKNFPEQSAEQTAFDPVRGSHHTVLAFEDCSLAPLICADLLADSQVDRPNAIDLLKQHRMQRAKPLILATSVLQDKPWHSIWSSRIDRAIDSGCILALANFSHQERPTCYEDDKNRNLSGVYASAGHITSNLPDSIDCSGRSGDTAKGSVLRDSCEVFTAGVLRVDDFAATTGRHLWLVRWGQIFSNSKFKPVSSRLNYEIPRLCHRIKHSPSNAGIENVSLHLKSSTEERKKYFFTSISLGPGWGGTIDPNPVKGARENMSTERALLVVDALSRTPYFPWPQDPRATLLCAISSDSGMPALQFSTYVWRSSSLSWTAMATHLQSYVDNDVALPSVVVFAQDMDGTDLNSTLLSTSVDVGTPREELALDPMSPRAQGNTVVLLPLSDGTRVSTSVQTAGFPTEGQKLRDTILKASGLAST